MKNVRGFTLVELLITISIIGILSAIGLVLYSTVLKQSRDSKRQSDLKSIQLALEQYNNDQGFYPSDLIYGGTGMATVIFTGGQFTNTTGNPRTPASTKTYMSSVPKDPTNHNTSPYYYRAVPLRCNNTLSQCTSYCLYTKLENPSSPIPPAPTGCSYPVGYNFAVTPP